MRNFRGPGILFLILLILGGIAYWDESKSKKEEVSVKDKKKISSFVAGNIDRIKLINRSDAKSPVTVELEKSGGKWRITRPIVFASDTEAVDRWLKTIEDLVYEKSFEVSDANLKNYGLDSPLLELSFSGAQGSSFSYKIGSKSPIGYSSYLQVQGDSKVYLVSHYAYTSSNKTLNDFRFKGLGFSKLEDIRKLEFSSSKSSIVRMDRNDQGWILSDQQPGEKVDQQKVQEFWSNISRGRIETFLDDPSPELRNALSLNHGGSTLLGRIKQVDNAGSEREWQLIENNSVIYATIPDSRGYVTVDKSIIDSLKIARKDFLDKTIFPVPFGKLSKVVLDKKEYRKTKEVWTDDKGNNAEFIQNLLRTLEFSKAEEFLSDISSVHLGRSLHKVSLVNEDGKTTSLEFFEQDGSQDHIYLVFESRVAVVKRSLLESIKPAVDKGEINTTN